jgi:hypothetical protein
MLIVFKVFDAEIFSEQCNFVVCASYLTLVTFSAIVVQVRQAKNKRAKPCTATSFNDGNLSVNDVQVFEEQEHAVQLI